TQVRKSTAEIAEQCARAQARQRRLEVLSSRPMLRPALVLFAFALVVPAGGGSVQPATAPDAESRGEVDDEETREGAASEDASDDAGEDADKSSAEASEEETAGIPTECAGKGEVCTPPGKWVSRLCADVHS